MRKKETKNRRARGDGAITYIESKKLYRGTIECGVKEDGKKITKTFYSKQRLKLVEKMKEFRAKTYGIKVSSSTFEVISKKWLMHKEKELNPKSFQRYEGIIDNYFSKADFYDKEITSISFSDVKTFLHEMKSLGASEKTIAYSSVRLKSIFDLAVKDELILRNPCNEIKIKKQTVSPTLIKAWTKEEQQKFLDYIKQSNEKYKYLFLLALGSGLRLGELLSLTWDDLDLNNQTVEVNKTVSRLRQSDKSYKDVITKPKSESSNRIVDLPKSLCLILDEIEHSEKTDLVFFDDKDYSFIYNKNPNRHLTRIAKKLEIPDITFHHLRSTYATRLFEAGVPIKVVQKLLGHSTMEMTERMYVQVMKDTKIESVEKINDLF